MRLGYMTAPPPLCAVVNMITLNTNLQPPTLTQIMAYTLLSRWGPNGFLTHCAEVARFYRTRRDAFERLLVHADGRDADSAALVSGKAVAKGVLAVPGTAFMPLGGPTPFVRVSFSIIEEDKAEEACRRLREVILEARAEAAAALRHDG
ncbi:pyridoxal phosphate-dependent transferase [Mycena epipterygia]|nr:pyridoxal phosphate-dependent transferase [Mycena epipterygia]